MVTLKAIFKGNFRYYQNKNASVYYAPIHIDMPTCLKCHWEVNEIDSLTFSKIKELYPSDEAVNYEIDEFRGAWKIIYTKNN